MPISSPTRQFQTLLLQWYVTHGRKLPWRQTTDPYAILVSEVMLQQTQVSRGLPKYQEWMKAYPNLETLSQATLGQVLKTWQGLGYNRRAKYLWAMTQVIQTKYGGIFPSTREELLQLPGIGSHTAGAILSFAFGSLEPINDTNARRVIGRVLKGFKKLPQLSESQWDKLLRSSLPKRTEIYAFNQALMDLGALLCTAKTPQCSSCPLQRVCLSYPGIQTAPARALRLSKSTKEKLYYGQPRRIWRGKILRHLHQLGSKGVSLQTLGRALQPDFQTNRLPWLRSVVKSLAQEELLVLQGNTVHLQK